MVEKGGNTFGMATPNPSEARTKAPPPPLTFSESYRQESSPEPTRPPKTRRWFAARLIGALLAVASVGVGGKVGYDHLRSGQEQTAVSDTFDPKALKGVIGQNNTVRMTLQEYEQSPHPPLIDGDAVNIPLFLQIPGEKIPTITYKKGPGMLGGIRQINPKGYNDAQGRLITTSDGETTVNDQLIINGIPAGTTLIAPFNGEIVFMNLSLDRTRPPITNSQFFLQSNEWRDNNENGARLRLNIQTGYIVPSIEGLSQVNPDGTNKYTPIPVRKGQSILTLINNPNSSSPIQLQISTDSASKGNDGSTRSGNADLQLATTPDGKIVTFK